MKEIAYIILKKKKIIKLSLFSPLLLPFYPYSPLPLNFQTQWFKIVVENKYDFNITPFLLAIHVNMASHTYGFK